jgi:glutaredoxin
MNNYYIKAIFLNNCSYSTAAKELLDNFKIPYKSTIISGNEKNNYVNDMIDTFPQLYLRKHNTFGNLLLGGYDELNQFIQTFKGQKLNDENIKKFMDKHKWSKKATLRLIQLVN